MKRDIAKNMRKACQYLITNLAQHEGQNVNRLGDKTKEKIKHVWERAKEICPELCDTIVIMDWGKNQIDISHVRIKLSRAVSYIHKWDVIDTSDTAQEYLVALEKINKITNDLMEEGLTPADLSMMGLLNK